MDQLQPRRFAPKFRTFLNRLLSSKTAVDHGTSLESLKEFIICYVFFRLYSDDSPSQEKESFSKKGISLSGYGDKPAGFWTDNDFSLMAAENGFLVDEILEYLMVLPRYKIIPFLYQNLNSYILSRSDDRDIGIRKVVHSTAGMKVTGRFYTPDPLAREFVEGALEQAGFLTGKQQDITFPVVCDLASGCGIFLLSLLEIYTVANGGDRGGGSVGFDIKEVINKDPVGFLADHLFAVDNDPFAIIALKTSLYFFILETSEDKTLKTRAGKDRLFYRLLPVFQNNILCVDLISLGSQGELFSFKRSGSLIRFDIVFSNPPYISFYSRHSQRGAYKGDLSAIGSVIPFMGNQGGRFNAIMLFIVTAFLNVKADGIVSLLVDMNIHEEPFSSMRKWIFTHHQLLKIVYNISGFSGVNSGQSIVYLKKSDLRTKKGGLLNQVTVKEYTEGVEVIIPETELQSKNRFFLSTPPGAGLFTFGVETIRLESLVSLSTGVNIGGARNYFLTDVDNDNSCIPFWNIQKGTLPYMIPEADGQFIRFDQDLVVEKNRLNRESGSRNVVALGPVSRFQGEKVFVLQSSLRLTALFSETPLVAPYSAFVITSANTKLLRVVQAVLNSSLMTNYARQNGIIRSGAGKQPQIRRSGLASLPFPCLSELEKQYDSIVDLVEILENKIKNGEIAGEKQLLENTTYKQIDFLVRSMYGLDINPV